jgi:hypothetical protein
MFGVMAGSVRVGVRALRDWCQGLGLPYVKPVSRVSGRRVHFVYINVCLVCLTHNVTCVWCDTQKKHACTMHNAHTHTQRHMYPQRDTYTHTHITYTHTHIHTDTCTHKDTHTHMHAHTHVHTYTHTRPYTQVCLMWGTKSCIEGGHHETLRHHETLQQYTNEKTQWIYTRAHTHIHTHIHTHTHVYQSVYLFRCILYE